MYFYETKEHTVTTQPLEIAVRVYIIIQRQAQHFTSVYLQVYEILRD